MQPEVEDARRHLDRLRRALLSSSPQEMEDGLLEGGRAVASLRDVVELAHAGARHEGLETDLAALSLEISVVRRLATRGLDLYSGWAGLLTSAVAGYVASGKPAPLSAASHIEIEG